MENSTATKLVGRELYTEEHNMFREAIREFLKKEAVPHYERWEKQGQVEREIWIKAAEMGILATDIPEEYGGLGLHDYRYNAIITEEMAKLHTTALGFGAQNDIVVPYLNAYCTPEQKAKYLPKMASGEWIGALGMTDPVAGSDLKSIKTFAERKDDHYVLNGSKTFITNGIHADVVVTFVKTSKEASSKSYTLFVLERGMEGFSRGKNLDKIGLKGQDTAELFFDNVKVPFENVLGTEGKGFYFLMHNLPMERLGIGVHAVAEAESILEETIQYCKDRKAFGKPIGSFQYSRFKLAEMKTELTIARTFIDECIWELTNKELTAEKAAMAKYWASDLQGKVIDQCLQLHGGYGYMNEYNVARAWRDARVTRIYGGTNEIMKEIIGRSLGF